ncbi:hypothetical protein [uncultured Erythrobacter sp.]|uniref:hypothetical protein n=1 Tax=uncultured Erythrobacter sp. TaxID=263913 RepID=UPI00260D2128|nr:hypothetical protein [uncultured Erythrobacter sp.]
MFGADPIDIFDPSPYSAIAYYGHFVLGTVALLAVFTALAVKKGKGLHRQAGLTFLFACAGLALTNISLLMEQFIAPLMMGAITSLAAMGGAYLALQARTMQVRAGEMALAAAQLAGLIWFLSIAIPEAASGNIPIIAPIVIAIIPLILLAGDVNWMLRPERQRQMRVARHLSRMIWAFVVVLRAPLVEFAAAGLPIPGPVVVIGPIGLGAVMIWYFQRRYGGSPFGKTA